MAPSVLGAHHLQRRLGAVDVAHQRDLHHALEVLGRQLLDRPHQGGHGAVDPGVDGPPGLHHLVAGGEHRLAVGHVGGQHHGLAARRLDLALGGLQSVLPPGEQGHSPPLAAEPGGDGAARPGPRAGDDDDGSGGGHEGPRSVGTDGRGNKCSRRTIAPAWQFCKAARTAKSPARGPGSASAGRKGRRPQRPPVRGLGLGAAIRPSRWARLRASLRARRTASAAWRARFSLGFS